MYAYKNIYLPTFILEMTTFILEMPPAKLAIYIVRRRVVWTHNNSRAARLDDFLERRPEGRDGAGRVQ
jgi:hypothetical protein